MFAVPGWNVAAAVKAQVETPKPKDPNKLGKKAQKRKEKQENEVNAENFVEHWDNVANGKGTKPVETKKPEAKVKVKDTKPVETQKAEANGVEATDDAAEEKRGKKRKRGKAGGSKNKSRAEDGSKKSEEGTVAEDKKVAAEEPAGEKPTTAEGESKRDKKKRKKDSKSEDTDATAVSIPQAAVNLLPEPAGLTPLQRSMRSKLASARFRHLNESLYTKPSADSASLFKQDPSMFEDYHRGFAQQVEVWPSNPVDEYVKSMTARGQIRSKQQSKKGKQPEPEIAVGPLRGDAKPLPRNFKGHCTVADLGCGTASLSYRLQPQLKNLNLTFHSFDLSQPTGPSAPLVTVADISALPLQDNSTDIAIFCLALMGTNWLDFIDEAYRILRWKGELWVSEIKSRFGRVDKKKGKAPINSIGSLKKNMDGKKGAGKKKDKHEEEGIAGSEDEAELAVNVDGADGKEGTDVSAFVEVLRKRGFVLDALPERQADAVDLSNKMFVKMQFVKAAHPSKGKNARDDQKSGAVAERGGGVKFGMKGKKFAAVKEGVDGGDEKDKAVLKPCLYKIR
jgi:ribosomal RNA-processing protein 8